MAAYIVAIVLRVLAGIIPLSILVFISLLTACSNHHYVDSAERYSVPPKKDLQPRNYRDFGIPSQWDQTGILVSQAKVKSRLMADMRLLMQSGFSCRIFKVTTQADALEYWLVADDFDNRLQARQAIKKITESGLWRGALSLVALPVIDPGEQVAVRSR